MIIIAPVGAYVGGILAKGITFLDTNMPAIVPTIVGEIQPFLVFFGMHIAIAGATFIGEDHNNILIAIITVIISFTVAFGKGIDNPKQWRKFRIVKSLLDILK